MRAFSVLEAIRDADLYLRILCPSCLRHNESGNKSDSASVSGFPICSMGKHLSIDLTQRFV